MRYEYAPLEAGEIRLVELPRRRPYLESNTVIAFRDEAVLDCRVIHAPLDNAPPFESLSYVWGTSTKSHAITLNKDAFRISSSLQKALSYLQHDDSPRMLWVDAICIDQENLGEKGEQVELMRKIYQTATSVAVILADEWDGMGLAFEFLETAAAHSERHIDPRLDPYLTVQGHDSASPVLRTNILPIPMSPWFDRLWTVQEYVLARDVQFYCGRRILDGKVLHAAYEHFTWHMTSCCRKSTVLPKDPVYRAFTRLAATEVARATSGGHDIYTSVTRVGVLETSYPQSLTAQAGPHTFLDSLDIFRWRKSLDPRDKIYGLAGLYYSDSVAEEVRKNTNYKLPAETVYTNFVHTMIRVTGKLNVLSRASEHFVPSLSLPSFVPDWTVGIPPGSPKLALMDGYDACGGRQADWTVVDPYSVSSKAIMLDTIAECGSPTEPETDIDLILRNWTPLAKIDFTEKSFTEKTGPFSRSSSFWHTLCGDILSYKFVESSQVSTVYQEEQRSQAEDTLYSSYLAWYQHKSGPSNLPGTDQVANFQIIFNSVTRRKIFATIGDGRYGLFPLKAVQGDRLAVLPGGNVPLVLRLVSPGTYQLIGTAYVHGIMSGEAFEESKLESILLV